MYNLLKLLLFLFW